jgi:hypothetical protein
MQIPKKIIKSNALYYTFFLANLEELGGEAFIVSGSLRTIIIIKELLGDSGIQVALQYKDLPTGEYEIFNENGILINKNANST